MMETKKAKVWWNGKLLKLDKYQVDEEGRIYGIRKQFIGDKVGCNKRYRQVRLDGNMFHMHRVIASTWLFESSDPNLQINHKNGNKHDNRTDNLEWVTSQQNVIHSHKSGLAGKPIYSDKEIMRRKEYAKKQHSDGILKSKGKDNPNYKGG